jgi:hypothetical protein
MCRCSNVSTLKLNNIPNFYRIFIIQGVVNFIAILKIIFNCRPDIFYCFKILNKRNKPICQIKWETIYGEDISWKQVWLKLKQVHVSNKIKKCNKGCEAHWFGLESNI